MRLPDRFAGARLTPRGVAFLVIAAAGLVVAYAAGWAALLAVAVFLAAAVVAAFASVVVAPPAIAVERRIDPPVVEQRRPARVRVSVRGAASGAFDWSERVPAAVQVHGTTAGSLRAGGPTLIEYEVQGRRRGVLEVGPFSVVRVDPLGLATTRRRVGGTDRLIVLPRLHEVAVPSVVTRTDPDSAASSAFGPVGDQRDIVAREYRPGDPMRSVDWRATAHRGELMVRTESAAAASSTAIALDSRADAWRSDAEFEWAVEYAASTAYLLGERRASVRLASARHARAAGDAVDALTALAVVERSGSAPRPAELIADLAGTDVRVLHLVTGAGSLAELPHLPVLPHGTTGLVTVVARPGTSPEVPPGWAVEVLDPAEPMGSDRG